MSTRLKWFNLFILPLFGIMMLMGHNAVAGDSLFLYTPFTKITVPPGEAIDYTIDVINKSSKTQTAEIKITGMPRGWDYVLKSAAWNVSQISVLPDEKKGFSLRVEVPMKVNKGTYRFNVVADGLYTLPLYIIVSEQGTFKTEFTTKQPNMEGAPTSQFTFIADLRNRTADDQLYALRADAPRGWNVVFKADYKQVTSVNVEANNSSNISIEVKAPDRTKAGTYKIPVSASTNVTSANLEFEVVITGTYEMELTTPTGLLSTSITAGGERRVELLLKNTGSSLLNDIKLSASAPVNWDVIFDPQNIDKLDPGDNAQIFATIKPDKKAIAGDYVTNIDARIPEVSSRAAFRISVKTPMLLGWIGVLIIFVALGTVYHLFRKYGRR